MTMPDTPGELATPIFCGLPRDTAPVPYLPTPDESRDDDGRCRTCTADVDHYLGCPDDPHPDYAAEHAAQCGGCTDCTPDWPALYATAIAAAVACDNDAVRQAVAQLDEHQQIRLREAASRIVRAIR